jgi:hypothetical protein
MGPLGKLGFAVVPSTAGASSPAARWGRGTQTNEWGRRLGSHGVDPCRWFGRSSARRWPAARQRRCLRCDAGSVEMWVELGHVWLWELEWRLGSSLELSVGHGHERRR